MGKRGWGVFGLLLACQAQGAPTLTVATDVWPPFRVLQPDGQFRGLDMDILQRLQSRSGIQFEVKRVPWGR
ncbi:transporter substrate-binding domain-containing protein, partial [Aeromonas salmonicida]